MGKKDITERILEDYDDVFADIVNGLIFNGLSVIGQNELYELNHVSQYKAYDDSIHSEERDVIKRWKKGMINVAVIGFENQTQPCRIMPIRAIGYDGAAYRSQLTEYDAKVRLWRKHKNEARKIRKSQKNDIETSASISLSKKPQFHPTPVLTIVLYFGTEHWKSNLNLKELLDIPDGMDKYINDYRINVFEIAWLTDEQISRFTSDFRIIANFFAKKRINPDYVPDDLTDIIHVDETLKMLSALTGDRKYEAINNSKINSEYGGKVKNMCEVADRLVRKGRIEGEKIGAEKNCLQNIKSIMENLKLTLQEAMDALNIPQNDRAELMTKLHF